MSFRAEGDALTGKFTTQVSTDLLNLAVDEVDARLSPLGLPALDRWTPGQTETISLTTRSTKPRARQFLGEAQLAIGDRIILRIEMGGFARVLRAYTVTRFGHLAAPTIQIGADTNVITAVTGLAVQAPGDNIQVNGALETKPGGFIDYDTYLMPIIGIASSPSVTVNGIGPKGPIPDVLDDTLPGLLFEGVTAIKRDRFQPGIMAFNWGCALAWTGTVLVGVGCALGTAATVAAGTAGTTVTGGLGAALAVPGAKLALGSCVAFTAGAAAAAAESKLE